jgi:predicted transcriptional regulator
MICSMSVKEQARMLVEALPEESTWEDLMQEIYVHESIQRGLEDGRAGRTRTSEEIRSRFQIPKA